ncbi:MAG: DUF2336 domain-containing protein [Alphaproteobacteria bacterium]|nr:DUF2336 domain-containing protein [Alphaproteobacteria bacterium]
MLRLFGWAGFGADATLSYEETKQLARHPSAKVRRSLANREDVRAEVLYYLAEDESPEVRRNIAVNANTPAQAHLLLAHDRDDRVRSDLALKISRLMPELSQDEHDRLQQTTYEVLEVLARDQLTKVRQILAETLKDVTAAPPGVIKRLAMDSEPSVAQPVLEFSPLLTDEDLLEIIKSLPVNGGLSAISRRKEVSSRVSDAIVAADDVPAITELLANPSAQIREETLDGLVEGSIQVEEWQSPLARRPLLPRKAVRKLATFVADSLLMELRNRTDLDPEVLNEVTEVMHQRLGDDGAAADNGAATEVVDQTAMKMAAEEPLQTVRRLHAEDKLDEDRVAEALGTGNHEFVTLALALKSGVGKRVVERVSSAQSAKGITALTWKSGFSMRFAVQLQTRFAHVGIGEVLNAKDGVDYPLSKDEMEWLMEFFAT